MAVPFTERGTMWREVVKEKDSEVSLVNVNLKVTYLWIYSIISWKYGTGVQGKYVA